MERKNRIDLAKKVLRLKSEISENTVKPSGSNITKWVFIIFSIFSIAFFSFVWWVGSGMGVRSFFSNEPDDNFSIILAGTDMKYHGQRTDTMLLGFVFPKYQHVALISLPRDTRVNIPGYGFKKLNGAYARGGIPLLRETLEKNFNILPTHYAVVNLDGFVNIIDILGGVDIKVEREMNYDDIRGNLHIHIKKGLQHFNGEKAMEYVRFREKLFADLGRIKRQQKFMKAILAKLKNVEVLWKLPALIKEVRNNINTDLSYETILKLIKTFNYFRNENFELHMMPGSPEYIGKASYFISDKDKFKKQIKDIKNKAKNFSKLENKKMIEFMKNIQKTIEISSKTNEVSNVQNTTQK